VVALVLTIAVGAWFYRILNGQRVASLLIETETEVKKVSWPTRADAFHSTWIVLGFVVCTALFLTVVELALRTVFTRILS
jgi:preprotein translocase subunit SecE